MVILFLLFNLLGSYWLSRSMFGSNYKRGRKFPDRDMLKFTVIILLFNLGGIAFCLQFMCP